MEKRIPDDLFYGRDILRPDLRSFGSKLPTLDLQQGDLTHRNDMVIVDSEFFRQVILVVGEEEYAFIHGRKGFQGSGLGLNAQKRLKLPYERRIMQ